MPARSPDIKIENYEFAPRTRMHTWFISEKSKGNARKAFQVLFNTVFLPESTKYPVVPDKSTGRLVCTCMDISFACTHVAAVVDRIRSRPGPWDWDPALRETAWMQDYNVQERVVYGLVPDSETPGREYVNALLDTKFSSPFVEETIRLLGIDRAGSVDRTVYTFSLMIYSPLAGTAPENMEVEFQSSQYFCSKCRRRTFIGDTHCKHVEAVRNLSQNSSGDPVEPMYKLLEKEDGKILVTGTYYTVSPSQVPEQGYDIRVDYADGSGQKGKVIKRLDAYVCEICQGVWALDAIMKCKHIQAAEEYQINGNPFNTGPNAPVPWPPKSTLFKGEIRDFTIETTSDADRTIGKVTEVDPKDSRNVKIEINGLGVYKEKLDAELMANIIARSLGNELARSAGGSLTLEDVKKMMTQPEEKRVKKGKKSAEGKPTEPPPKKKSRFTDLDL